MTSQADLEQVVGLIAQSISHQLAQRSDEALQCLNQALQLAPDFPPALAKRGTMLQSLSRYREAVADFDRCLFIKSDLTHIVSLRDVSLQGLLKSLDYDLRQDPLQLPKLYERGLLMMRLRRKSEALTNFREVLAIDAYHAGALNSMGNVLLLLNRHEQALACYEKIVALSPDDVVALVNRGNVLQQNARYYDALASYAKALEVRPGFAEVLIEQAHCQLAMGNLPEGWALFEARWDTEQLRRAKPQTNAPMWHGETINDDGSLFLWAEQGLGDTLQFVRYLPLAAQRASRIVIRVPASLRSLIADFAARIMMDAVKPTSIEVIANDQAFELRQAQDVHCPLMSLPLIFGSDLQSLPATIPYLHAPQESIEKWRSRLGARTKRRIGVVWAGGQRLLNNPTRDMRLDLILPLLERKQEVDWFSLQQAVSEADAEILAQLPQVHCPGDELTDFADTAGLISQLDLIISIDSSVAHLAGALGKPVWLMLRKAGEWRWMHDRTDSPWYPRHRIFRQQLHGEWATVVQEIAENLQT